jgi:hypothetical protein
MARTWMNDGKPTDDGRLCLIIDPENGTQPIRVWGRSKEEILEKAAKTVEHGARTISELRAQITPPSISKTPASAPPPVSKRTLSVEEQMRLTADLSNPAKAPAAVRKLLEFETGLDLKEMQHAKTMERIANIQANWSYSHPEFPKHPVNYKLINDAATLRVGYENITAEVMDQVYHELSASGLLVAAEESQPPTPTVPPDETPATRTVRPRGATSMRRTFASPAPAAASRQPKYTKAQIDAMSSAELRRRMETEPGFAEALTALAPPAASAHA